jgi:hypothetical protein
VRIGPRRAGSRAHGGASSGRRKAGCADRISWGVTAPGACPVGSAAIGCGRPAARQSARPGPEAVGQSDTAGLSWTGWDMIQNLRRAGRHIPGLRTPHGQSAVFTRRKMGKRQVSDYSDRPGSAWSCGRIVLGLSSRADGSKPLAPRSGQNCSGTIDGSVALRCPSQRPSFGFPE